MASAEEIPRRDALNRWWTGLNRLDRERARYFAATTDTLPRQLFLSLADAGVLAVDSVYRARVADRSASTFPMPPDVRAYVRNADVTSADS